MQTNQLKGNNGPRYRQAQTSQEPYEAIEVKKLTPIIGAEIAQVDLSKPLSSSQKKKYIEHYLKIK